MPQAIARSKPGPSLRRWAGARLTVMRLAGNAKPELRIAARTRSRASRTARSPRPTIVKLGRPVRTSTSTVTRRLSTPWIANVVTWANMPGDAMGEIARRGARIATILRRPPRGMLQLALGARAHHDHAQALARGHREPQRRSRAQRHGLRAR